MNPYRPNCFIFQTFVAIAVPLDIPDKNVFVSYNFESNYSVVTNITQIDEVIFPNLPVSIIMNFHSVISYIKIVAETCKILPMKTLTTH